jgi:hypothetical protein
MEVAVGDGTEPDLTTEGTIPTLGVWVALSSWRPQTCDQGIEEVANSGRGAIHPHRRC